MKLFLVIFCVLFSTRSFGAVLDPTLHQILDIYEGKTTRSRAANTAILQSLSLGDTLPSEILVLGKGDVSAVMKYGARVQTKTFRYFTALIPVSSLSSIQNEKAVEFLYYGPPLRPLMDQAFPYVSANQSEAAGYRGDDVIVGVVDTGLDINHQDFLSDNGLSRVLYLWDQTADGSGPENFGYGKEWTKYDIDNGFCTAIDEQFHGTHVTGIAAGSGKRSGGTYRGISPRANIVFVKAVLSLNYVYDAVSYIFFRAQQMNKPCVVNISLGNHYGSHTEYDDYNLAMDDLVNYYGKNGRVIVWAAGNEGATSDGVHTRTNAVSVDTSVPFNYGALPAVVYFWYTNANLTVRLRNNGGTIVLPFTNTSTFSSLATTDFELYSGANPAGEKYVALVLHASSSYFGTWNMDFQQNPAAGQIDGYIANYDPDINNKFNQAWRSGSITSQACQKLALSVGAIVTRTNYTDILGNPHIFPTYNMFDLVYFSSRGPTRDGKNKPDVSAPGAWVIAPYANTPGLSLPSDKRINEFYAILQGTSMAAPVVTGIVAQILEKEPYLTVDDIRQLFINYAKTNDYKPDRNWNGTFGYGIADLSFLTSVNAAQAKIDVSLKNNVMNVTGDKDNQLYVLLRCNSTLIGSTVRAAVYDRNGGLIRDFGSERIDQIKVKEYSWNGKDQFARTVQPGLYFLLVSVDNAVSRYPVLVVR